MTLTAHHQGLKGWGLRLLVLLLAFFTVPALAVDTLPLKITEPRFGDLDSMLKHRQIRALVAWSKTGYFIDKGQQRGISWESARDFEKYVNTKLKRGKQPIAVVMIPVSRDKLITYLEQGRGDIAIAGLTITAGRTDNIDFSAPVYEHANELIVRNKNAEHVTALTELSGKTIHLRPSSSYYESVQKISAGLVASGRAPIKVAALDEYLADEDILEMMNAGLIDYTVLDDFRAELWADIFPEVVINPEAVVASNQPLAFGLRKKTPKFKALVDGFVQKHKVGTAYGNILAKRYFGSNVWARNSLSPQNLVRYQQMVNIFKRYSTTYKFDYLMMTAQGFQESGLDQKRRSHVGAIGVMQVMPATGKSLKVGDIRQLEPNIHAGVKYMNHLADVYFDDPAIDDFNRTLFCFAAYNAGPTRVSKLRKVAAQRGLDPNVWFDNVERVVAEKVGREPVQYVMNISKYYVAYKMVDEQQQRRDAARHHLEDGKK